MKQGIWKSGASALIAAGMFALAGAPIAANPVAAQAPADCPLPAGSAPVEPPRVTAQWVEDGSASLADFAADARSRAREPDSIWRADRALAPSNRRI